jgi:hypothetical protein
VPRTSDYAANLRGTFAFVYTGALGERSDRAFMYLNKTIDGEEAVCQLTPISYFTDIRY